VSLTSTWLLLIQKLLFEIECIFGTASDSWEEDDDDDGGGGGGRGGSGGLLSLLLKKGSLWFNEAATSLPLVAAMLLDGNCDKGGDSFRWLLVEEEEEGEMSWLLSNGGLSKVSLAKTAVNAVVCWDVERETTGVLLLLLLLLLDVTSIDFFYLFDARAPLLLDEDDDDEEEHDDEVDLASALLLFLDFLADEVDRKEPFPLVVLLFAFITLLLFPFVKLDGVDEAVMVVSNSSSLTDDEHEELFDSVATFCLLLLLLLLFTVLERYSLWELWTGVGLGVITWFCDELGVGVGVGVVLVEVLLLLFVLPVALLLVVELLFGFEEVEEAVWDDGLLLQISNSKSDIMSLSNWFM